MDVEKLIEAVRLCGSTPKVDQCKQCAYWAGGDMRKCIPRMTEDAAAAITDLLARAEAAEKELEWKNMVIEAAERRFTEAEAKCKRLDESRERANESAHMWESRCKMLEERAEKAERDRDAAISDLTFAVNQYRLFTTDIDLCGLCKFDLPAAGESGQTAECPGYYKDNCFEWRGAKEE